jgi:lysophospholipase L1-like esterase
MSVFSGSWSFALRRSARTCLAALALLVFGVSALRAAESGQDDPWQKDIDAFEARDLASPPSAGGIVFVGSSTIRLWDLARSFPELAPINRGFGGSQIADSVRHFERLVLAHRPRIVVFYAGDNDIAVGKTPARVFADFVAFATRLRETLPSTELIWLPIKPSVARWGLIEPMREVNALVEALSKKEAWLRYVDTHTAMLGSDGRPDPRFLAEDGLHLSPPGYELWNATLRPWLGPQIIRLPIPGPADAEDSAGGIIAADIDGDARAEIIVTCRGNVVAVSADGTLLWTMKADIAVGGSSELEGLPGHHGPGVTAGDVDGDHKPELIFLTRDSAVHVLDGASGREELVIRPPVPEGAERWELVLVATFRGEREDADVLLQATNRDGYRMGRHLAAYSFDDLAHDRAPLWTSSSFVACAHNGARLADLDHDGRDEVLGATILGPDGRERTRAAPFDGHMDSVFVADVRPELPGLEVVLLEEGSNHVQVLGLGGPIWRSHSKRQEPQNAVVGRFRGDSEEIQIWCRSRYSEHQRPFVFDARGELVAEYALDDVAPAGWTTRGVEVIHRIDWTGGETQLACAKERHERGDVALFEPLSGRFVRRIPEEADRLYVADVRGDWREEIIVLRKNELRIYENFDANPRPERASLWTDRNYRRLRQAHNYYSP